MGIVSSIGHDIAAFARSLAEGRSGVKRISRETSPALAVDIGAEIEDFDSATALARSPDLPGDLLQSATRVARRSPFAIQASVAGALQAWTQARLHASPVAPERLGLVIAGHNTTQSLQYALQPGFRRDPEYLSPRYALQHMDSDQLGVLSEILGIRGEGFVVGGASASGNIGAIHGARLIAGGLVDACLVVGVVADLSPMEVQAFHAIGALGGKAFRDQPAQACRPFDARHEGFLPGQAAACLVLESGASAERRGVPRLARWLGGAIALHASATSEPDAGGEVRAMREALRQSGLGPGDIDYVNTHGTSSPLGDRAEIEAIAQVFGEHFPRVWLNATKGLTGHCLHSAGVVEIVATVIQMQQGFLHANLNLEEPINAKARFCGTTAVPHAPRNVLSNSFGFGGINTCVALQADG